MFIITLPIILVFSYLQSLQARMLEFIIDTIPFPVFFKDNYGRYIKVNTALAKLFGYENKDKLIGKVSYDVMEDEVAKKSNIRDNIVLKKGKIVQEDELLINKGKKVIRPLLYIVLTLIFIKLIIDVLSQ